MMIIFLSIYILLYGGIHFWMASNLFQAYAFNPVLRWVVIFWMLLMVLLPILLAFLERKHLLARVTRSISWLAFTWMGIIFLMLMSFIALSLIQWSLGLLHHRLGLPLPSVLFTLPLKMTLTLSLVALLTLAAFREASHVRIEKMTLTTNKLQSAPLRIVQISDLHLGTIIREDYLRKITEKIKAHQPDMIVCTGDLVDAPLASDGVLANMLADLEAPLGKFAIMGNHEYIAGGSSSLAFLKSAGFDLLRNEKRVLPNGILVAGVDDPAGKYFDHIQPGSEKGLLDGSEQHGFRILLKHRPVIEKESPGLFDLQLSGHTHKGQLFPFNIFTRLAFHYHSGLFELQPQQWLYVSRGTGTWGPPMRLLAAPELTVIDIHNEQPL